MAIKTIQSKSTVAKTNAAKVNVATAQAIQAGAKPRDLEIARQYLGTSKFIGYCQSFVRQVTGGKTNGASAIAAWNNAPQKVQGTQGMQPGDLVYFNADKSNQGFGHTGIFAGNNQFISATDNGIRQTDLGSWMKATGQKLLGYVPAVERALGLGGQQGSQQTQSNPIPPTPQLAISHNVQMRQAGMQSQVPIPMPPTPDQSQQSPSSNIELDPRKMNQGANLSQNA